MEDIQKTIENAARLAGEKGLIRFTRFLDPAQAIQAQQIAKAYGAYFDAWGGYEHAERIIGCFYPHGDEVAQEDFPLLCLHSRYSSKFCSLTHRDLLGSFMALGLTRDSVGDMIIVESDVYLFVYAQTADYIAQSLKSAGKVPLDFSVLSHIPQMPDPEGTYFSSVVSSLRLDAVLAAAYKLSRSESADMIRAGIVKVNHQVCDRVDMQLSEAALLSVRGRGRIRLASIDGLTKKQRIGITFFRYV